jgi:hypothetical protein
VAAVGPFIFLYGGLVGSTLHSDLLLADDGGMKDLVTYDARSPPWMTWLESTNQAASMLAHNAAEEAAAASSIIVQNTSMEAPDSGEADSLSAPDDVSSRDGSNRALQQAAQPTPPLDAEEGEQQVCTSSPGRVCTAGSEPRAHSRILACCRAPDGSLLAVAGSTHVAEVRGILCTLATRALAPALLSGR